MSTLDFNHDAQEMLNRSIDALPPAGRVKYLLTKSSDAPIYILGLAAGVVHLATMKMRFAELFVTSAYAQDSVIGLLGQGKNFIATLIFIALIISLGGAIFTSGPGRTAAETFAKLLAGGLVGFVSGTKV